MLEIVDLKRTLFEIRATEYELTKFVPNYESEIKKMWYENISLDNKKVNFYLSEGTTKAFLSNK